MGEYVGADWASNGWVAAALDDAGDLTVGFYPTVWNLWHDRGDDAERVLADVPVGLPEDGRRECDREARERLGDRRSSVFWTPVRDAAYEDNVEDAKAVQTAATGHSISNQAWAIVPRVREVDTFLRETDEARAVVRESHPEVCFRALRGQGDRVGPKSGDDGLAARRSVLESETPVSAEDCARAVGTLARPNYARFAAEDDVLDAVVLAATARRAASGESATLPDDPPTDGAGLPMEIVYPDV